MKIRFLFPVAVAILLAISAAAVACGDDDEAKDTATPSGGGDGGSEDPTAVQAYLEEVDEIQDGVTEATDAVGDQSDSFFSDPPKARQALSAAADIGEAAVVSLEGLNPPADAQAAHDRLISAGTALVAAVNSYATRLVNVEAGPDFDEIIADADAADSDLSKAIEDMTEACDLMQLFAADFGSDVELSCPKAP